MGALASEIVNDAYREGNIIGINTAPTTPEIAEGLKLLNRWIDTLVGFELGEMLFDWPVPTALTAPTKARYPLFPRDISLKPEQIPYPPSNVNILLNPTEDTTIYLNQTPADGARMRFTDINSSTNTLTVDGNGRKVRGGLTFSDTVVNWGGINLLYRADLGEWVAITALLETDASPLPDKFDDLLVLGTFMRLARRQGRTMDAEQATTFKRLLRILKAQYRQPTPSPADPDRIFPTPASDFYGRNRLLGGGLLE